MDNQTNENISLSKMTVEFTYDDIKSHVENISSTYGLLFSIIDIHKIIKKEFLNERAIDDIELINDFQRLDWIIYFVMQSKDYILEQLSLNPIQGIFSIEEILSKNNGTEIDREVICDWDSEMSIFSFLYVMSLLLDILEENTDEELFNECMWAMVNISNKEKTK